MANFGEIFLKLQETSPLTMEEVAEKLGISKSYVYNFKNKKSADSELISNVCRLFKVSPLVFFDKDLRKFGMVDSTKNELNNTGLIAQATMNIGMIDEIRRLEQILEEKERFIQFLLKGRDGVGNVNL